MSRLLVSITAGNEEHGGTVGHCRQDGTGGNSSARRIDLAATGSISWKCTTLTGDIV